jgi:uncharacterized protein (TIGR02246 family)
VSESGYEVAADAIHAMHAAILQAWNDRDAREFARPFAADATMIGFDGSQVTGSDIESHLRPIFEGHPTARYVAKVREVRRVGASAVLLRAIVGMVPAGQTTIKPDVNAVQTMLVEHRGNQWQAILLQNTPAQHHGRPDLVKAHTAELQRVVDAEPDDMSS